MRLSAWIARPRYVFSKGAGRQYAGLVLLAATRLHFTENSTKDFSMRSGSVTTSTSKLPLPGITTDKAAQAAKIDLQLRLDAMKRVLFIARDEVLDKQGMPACKPYNQVLADLKEGGTTTTATGLPQSVVHDLEQLGLRFVASAGDVDEADPSEQAPPQQAVADSKDSPEFHAQLLMSVPPPRGQLSDAEEFDEPPPAFSDSDVDEGPPPPELSKSGMDFFTTMTGDVQRISTIPDLRVATIFLDKLCDSLLDKIKDHIPASDKTELTIQLRICLQHLDGPLQGTDQLKAVIAKVEVAEEAPSPAAVSLRTQTAKALKVYAACLEGSDAGGTPDQFSARTRTVLPAMVGRIQAHTPEGERYKLVVQLANDLCAIAQSPNAGKHPHQRAELVKFLATVLGPASSTMGADEPHHQKLREGLDRMLRPYQAEFPVREPAIAARQRVNNAIKTALAGADRIDTVPGIAKLIETLPMTAAEKNECFAELDLRFRTLIAQTPDRGTFRKLVEYHRAEALKTIHEHVSVSPAWPEPAAYQALTDAVSEINRDMEAREKARRK
jgi:hypothetical protein